MSKNFWLGFFFGFSFGMRLPQLIEKLLGRAERECYLCGRALPGLENKKCVPHGFIREAIAGGLSPFRVPDCGPFLLRMFEIRRKKFPAYDYLDFREDFESFWKAIVLLGVDDWWLCGNCVKIVLQFRRKNVSRL